MESGFVRLENKPPVGDDQATLATPVTEPVSAPVGLLAQTETGGPADTVGAGLMLIIMVS